MNDHRPGGPSPLGWLLSFLAGGVVGASAALLLAPQSGRATRDVMRGKLSHTASSARSLKDQLIRRGRKVREEAGHRVDGAVAALRGEASAKPSV